MSRWWRDWRVRAALGGALTGAVLAAGVGLVVLAGIEAACGLRAAP